MIVTLAAIALIGGPILIYFGYCMMLRDKAYAKTHVNGRRGRKYLRVVQAPPMLKK